MPRKNPNMSARQHAKADDHVKRPPDESRGLFFAWSFGAVGAVLSYLLESRFMQNGDGF